MKVLAGSTSRYQGTFRDFSDPGVIGPLVDPDGNAVVVRVLDGGGAVLDTGSATRVSLGVYRYDWTPAEIGGVTVEFSGVVAGKPQVNRLKVKVVFQFTDAEMVEFSATDEVANALALHVDDATDSHDASSISVTPTGSISSTNVQDALVEVADEANAGSTALSDHLSDSEDSHGASTVSYAPAGAITASHVQAAIDAVLDKIGRNTPSATLALVDIPNQGANLSLFSRGNAQMDTLGVGGEVAIGQRHVSHAGAPFVTPLVAKGAASQTADLQQWQNSAGAVLAKITSAGVLDLSGANQLILGNGPQISSPNNDGSLRLEGGVSGPVVFGRYDGTNQFQVNANIFYHRNPSVNGDAPSGYSINFVDGDITHSLASGLKVANNNGVETFKVHPHGSTTIKNFAETDVSLTLTAHASQTANLQENRSTDGFIYSYFTKTGRLVINGVAGISDPALAAASAISAAAYFSRSTAGSIATFEGNGGIVCDISNDALNFRTGDEGGVVNVNTGAPDRGGLFVTARPAQTADFAQFTNSAGVTLARITAAAQLGLGVTPAAGYVQEIVGNNVGSGVLRVRNNGAGDDGTVSVFEGVNSAGTTTSRITVAGQFKGSGITDIGSTVSFGPLASTGFNMSGGRLYFATHGAYIEFNSPNGGLQRAIQLQNDGTFSIPVIASAPSWVAESRVHGVNSPGGAFRSTLFSTGRADFNVTSRNDYAVADWGALVPLRAGHDGDGTITGNLFELYYGATTRFAVTKAGLPQWAIAGSVQTTVGAAGGASALPATPSKYLKVVGDDGVTYVIPAYAAN